MRASVTSGGSAYLEDRDWRGVFEPPHDTQRFADVEVDRQMGTIAWPE
jgi:hypothetical protein